MNNWAFVLLFLSLLMLFNTRKQAQHGELLTSFPYFRLCKLYNVYFSFLEDIKTRVWKWCDVEFSPLFRSLVVVSRQLTFFMLLSKSNVWRSLSFAAQLRPTWLDGCIFLICLIAISSECDSILLMMIYNERWCNLASLMLMCFDVTTHHINTNISKFIPNIVIFAVWWTQWYTITP